MPVAAVYSVTLLICLAVFGIVGYFAVRDFVPGAEAQSSEADGSDAAVFTVSDSLTTMYTLSDSQNNLRSVLIAKFIPSSQKIIVIPLSPLTECDSQTLQSRYSSLGAASLAESLSSLLGIKIDKYMTMSDTTFSEIVNIMGTTIVTLVDDAAIYDKGTDDYVYYNKGDRIAVDGAAAVELIFYDSYPGGPSVNMKLSGEITAALINNFFSHTESARNNIDSIFRKQYSDANTNMSQDEYNQMKSAIIYVIENSSNPSYSLTPTGGWSEDGTFVIDSTFISQLGGYLEE